MKPVENYFSTSKRFLSVVGVLYYSLPPDPISLSQNHRDSRYDVPVLKVSASYESYK
jgi:hypothetical protein